MLNTSRRSLEDILTRIELDYMSWRCLEDISARRSETSSNFLKTSRRYFDVFARRLEDFLKRQFIKINIFMYIFCKTSWKRIADKSLRYTYSCWLIHLEDVFWRHMTKANILVSIKRSRRQRRKMFLRCLQNFFIKTNVW